MAAWIWAPGGSLNVRPSARTGGVINAAPTTATTNHIQCRLPRDTRASLYSLKFSIMTFSPRDNILAWQNALPVVRGKTLFGFTIELKHEKWLNSRGWFSDNWLFRSRRPNAWADISRVSGNSLSISGCGNEVAERLVGSRHLRRRILWR
ncbi:hypothetical protein KMZ93_15415 [Bradyrhizobium sediminis]|uniref:Uncharacterized protein n=1 Tax=Bradyrhizobium sediminis TaxID=2840469 RepID=A0A975NU31_9BRAD|nr:hypothetical protein [Bradyrhizobium sediminis]QWG21407.1 hypothetical protein KMZ93_15415 [Bradyrhizobium sediminis]